MNNILVRVRERGFGPDESSQEMNEGQFEMWLQSMFPQMQRFSEMMARFEENNHLEFSRNGQMFFISA
jgi:hypothetical protein